MPVIGHENNYLVSNLGKIKSLNYRKTKGVHHILAQMNHSQGYLSCVLGRGESYLIHRIVAEAFIPNPLGKAFVNHKDGNKKNNRVENLEWCTRKENEHHAFATGLKNSTGSENVCAKLCEADIVLIRFFMKDESSVLLAKKFGVTTATINRIRQGVIWKHVDKQFALNLLLPEV